MRVYRSDAGWQDSEKDIRADAVIVSMSSTKLSLGMVASLQPAALSPGKIIVPCILIGGVILDQPADGGIGAVGRRVCGRVRREGLSARQHLLPRDESDGAVQRDLVVSHILGREEQ